MRDPVIALIQLIQHLNIKVLPLTKAQTATQLQHIVMVQAKQSIQDQEEGSIILIAMEIKHMLRRNNTMRKIFYLITALLMTSVGYSQTAEEYSKRGSGKYDLKDYMGAISDYSKAIEINPNYAGAYFGRGTAKYRLQDFRGAIPDLTKAIEINPNDAKAYTNRGVAKAELKDYNGAIADNSKAIELDPNNREAYYARGFAKSNLQDFRGAIADYTKVIEINPNDKWAYLARGMAKIELDQKDSGCLDLSKAGELGIAEAYEAIKIFCL